MKIVFLVSNLGSGGSERTVAYMSDYLAQKGWDVTVMTLSGENFYELDPKVRCVNLNIPYVPFAAKSALKWFYHFVRRRRLPPRAIKKIKPDIVFCMLPRTVPYLSAKTKKSYCLIGSERTAPSHSSRKSIQRKTEAFSLCDGVIFQTQRALEFYPDMIQKRGRVIPNAIGNPFVAQAVKPTQRAKKISAMGRLADEKDYPTLMRAFTMVNQKYSDYRLEIYGEGPDKEQLIRLSQTLGIQDRVDFCGADPKAILHIADASCYVLCSIFEGMPNALMEAMAVGLPCVSTDCPNGPAELIRNGENGLLVPVGDAEKLAEAILKMLDDPSFAEACGERAKDLRNTHSMENMAQAYMNYIEEVYLRTKTPQQVNAQKNYKGENYE